MKKIKKCFRSVTGDNFDPQNCIKEECSAWVKMDKLEGCSFVLQAVTTIIKNIEEGGKGRQETADDTDSKDNTQGGEGRIDDTETGGEKPTDCDTTEEDAKEPVKGSEVSKDGVITPITSGESTMKPIDNGVYKGDPA